MHQCHDGSPARYTTVEAIAEHYCDELRSVQAEGPYSLGGYSFGGLVAFEMARQLTLLGEDVALLVLVEPTTPCGAGLLRRGRSEGGRVAQDPGLLAAISHGLERFTAMPAHERVHWITRGLLSWLKQLTGAARLERSLKRLVYRRLVKHGRQLPRCLRVVYLIDLYMDAASRYSPESCSAPAFFVEGRTGIHGRILDWENLLGEKVEVHRVPGNHVSIIQEPEMGFWAARLRERLAEAQSSQR
jgi:thioesterase domain-containing protein